MSAPVLALALGVAAVAGARGTWSPCGLSMISAINPMSEQARGHRYGLTCAWFVAGAALGGALLGALGAVLALLAGPVLGSVLDGAPAVLAGLVAVAALVCLAADVELGGFRLPLLPRQVNERWLADYRRWLYAAGFGAQIGFGFSTYVMTAANYLLVVLMAATGSPGRALGVGVAFGLVRGAAALLAARARDPERLRALHRRLDRLGPASLAVCALAEAVVAVVAAAALGPVAGAAAVLALAAVVAPSLLAALRARRARSSRRTAAVA